MISTLFRYASLSVLLCFVPAVAGEHYTRMVKSEPVVENGLEFVAAVEQEWICFNPPSGMDTVQVQLFIHNTTQESLLFSIFDSFGIRIMDSKRNEIATIGGGRDGTLRTKSVIIDAGGTYCLSRRAELSWTPEKNVRSFSYYDGTGAIAILGPLYAGNYTLSFWCNHSEKKPLEDSHAQFIKWSGKTTTKEVAFKIIDP